MIVDIKGYEGLYTISINGEVCSLDRDGFGGSKLGGVKPVKYKGRVLKPGLSGNGYLTVVLRKNSKSNTHCIHRLIAEHFLPNPENKKEINHINGIRTDNSLNNLEWVTPSENMINKYTRYKHSAETVEKIVSKKRIKVLDQKTGVCYNSISDASFHLGINRTYLISKLNGKYKNNTSLIKIL